MMMQNFFETAPIIIGSISLILIIYLLTIQGREKLTDEKLKVKIKLTVKSIIRWEQLNNKPFSSLDYNSEDDVISLFYTCYTVDEINCSLDEFKESLNIEVATEMVKDFERETSMMAQFQKKASEKPSKESNNTENDDPVYIKNLVPILIMNGLDAHFALNEMELCDLSIYLEAYDQKVKDRLESTRLWTFLLLTPHLTKKMKSPKDLYPFQWELESMKEESETDRMESKDILKSFIKNGLN